MPNDWRGTPIEIGSTVVYGVNQGFTAMREGRVEVLTSYEDPWMDYGPQGSGRSVKRFRTCWKIGIRALSMSSRGPRNFPLEEAERLSYPMFQNVTIVSAREE